jgi:flagellin
VQLGSTQAQTMTNLAAAMQVKGISASASNGVLTIVGGTATTSLAGANDSGLSATTTSTGAATINLVNAAITQIGQTLSALGSATTQLQGLSDFTNQLSTSVTTSLGSLVDANLSEESAMLSSLQTKQSLAIQSLSLANQGPGALMQLFR